MSRIQLALNVEDLQQSVDFYSRLFGTDPAKVRAGYANFAVEEPPLKLILIENAGHGGSVNHLGVEVSDTDAVDAEQVRLGEAGLTSIDERNTTCCYAQQDKFWVEGAPNGESWEIYTVLADSPTSGGHADSSDEDTVAQPASQPARQSARRAGSSRTRKRAHRAVPARVARCAECPVGVVRRTRSARSASYGVRGVPGRRCTACAECPVRRGDRWRRRRGSARTQGRRSPRAPSRR